MRHEFIILADSPGALVEVCGISLLERHLRTLQRLGVTKVDCPLRPRRTFIASHLARPSRHRAKVAVDLRALAHQVRRSVPQIANALPNDAKQFVVIRGDCLFDSRLLQLLDDQNAPAALVDSAPPASLESLVSAAGSTKRGRLCGAALLSREWLQSSS